ncbi:hypothetical protein ACQPYK_50105 (plasmid) [Streptosporangium sp. CA-135522]|uniref:hypothetical protein n=1 Tax=Streptosporangium sp. CA-135522 TaxID=3240072 RepID=UPI003D9031EB
MSDQGDDQLFNPQDSANVDLDNLILEVRAIIIKLVPEAVPIIQQQQQLWEEEEGIPLSLYEYVGYLAQTLIPSLEEGNAELTLRGLQAMEELLEIPSAYLRETIDIRIIEPFLDLLLEVRELCGPKVLAMLESTSL